MSVVKGGIRPKSLGSGATTLVRDAGATVSGGTARVGVVRA
jgi:hypothetical protein